MENVSFSKVNKFSWKKLVLVCVLSYLIGVGIRCIEVPFWQHPYFEVQGEKLLATHDAYLWVATAKGTSRIIDAALPEIVRFLHSITGIKMGNLAFWLPVFLSPLVVVPVCFLAFSWGMGEGGIIASILSGVGIGYLLRTRVGFFDTDIGSLFFLTTFACFLASWLGRRLPLTWNKNVFFNGKREQREETTRRDVGWAVLIGIVGAVYKWFHPGAQKLTFIFLILAFCLYLYFTFPRKIRLSFISCFLIVYSLCYGGLIGAILALCLAICVLNLGGRLPRNLYYVIFGVFFLIIMWDSNVVGILCTIYHKAFYWLKPSSVELEANNTGILLPSISQSIREAQNIDWHGIVLRCAGNWIVFFMGIVGMLYLLIRRPFSLLIVPFFILGIAASKMGNRFTMYAGVGWGIGIGFGTVLLLERIRWIGRKRFLVILLFSLIVLWSPFMIARTFRANPVVTKIYAQTFLELHQLTPKDARLWQWWDYGYAAQYYAGRMSFCDGGLNYGDWVYPLAVVHTTSSPLLANQLIKFITLHQRQLFKKFGPLALDRKWWIKRLKLRGERHYWGRDKLKDMVPGWYPPYYLADPLAGIRSTNPSKAEAILLKLKTHKMKFPSNLPPQYFVVSWQNLSLGYWITYFGNWDIVTGTTVAGRIFNVTGDVRMDFRGGKILVNGKVIPLQSMDIVAPDNKKHIVWNKNNTFFHAIYNPISHELFLMDDTAYYSMMVQLLIGDPDQFKDYFQLVVDHYPWARAYKVK